MMKACLGFWEVNPNRYGDYHQIKSHKTVSSTLLFKCKQPKKLKQIKNKKVEKKKWEVTVPTTPPFKCKQPKKSLTHGNVRVERVKN